MRHTVAAMFALSLSLTGCGDSHVRGDDAGSGTDAGRTGSCGGETCGAGQLCCTGCPGTRDFCVTGDMCPLFDCPPPPPGCESCGGGEICCPSCSGRPSFCTAETECVPPPCPPPPTCDATLPCPGGFYCDLGDSCRGPGFCSPTPAGCSEERLGVCGCDGRDYWNSCLAAQAGVSVAYASFCAPPIACGGLPYCGCVATPGCEPLIDTTTGCVCLCDDPFNCTGDDCDCDCGGAQYRECAPVGRCPMTELTCDLGCSAYVGSDDGCLVCLCAVPG